MKSEQLPFNLAYMNTWDHTLIEKINIFLHIDVHQQTYSSIQPTVAGQIRRQVQDEASEKITSTS